MARDMHCPCGCVGREDTLIPQHRVNRGAGGSKLLDKPSNILVLCSETNGMIESDAAAARKAREYGWKLSRWQATEDEPFYDVADGAWYLIDDEYNRAPAQKRAH